MNYRFALLAFSADVSRVASEHIHQFPEVTQDGVNLKTDQGGVRGGAALNDSKARPVQVSTDVSQFGGGGLQHWCVCANNEKAVVLKIDCDIQKNWQGTSDYLSMYVKDHKDESWSYPTFTRITSGDLCNVDWLGFGGYFFAPGGNSESTKFCLRMGEEIVLEIKGDDALMVDKVYFEVNYGRGEICDTTEEFSVGGDNTVAWCLSTDPNDANSNSYQNRCTNALKLNVEDRTIEYFHAPN